MKKILVPISLLVFLALISSAIATSPCKTLGQSCDQTHHCCSSSGLSCISGTCQIPCGDQDEQCCQGTCNGDLICQANNECQDCIKLGSTVSGFQQCCDGYIPRDRGDGVMVCWTIGEQGPLGPTGPTGEEGQQGVQGEQGSQGPTGEEGSQGPSGGTGPSGGSGSSGFGELVGYLGEVKDWWNGKITQMSDTATSLYNTFNTVFVNRNDFNNLTNRVTALENTVEKTNNEAYCQGKIQAMIDFNLTSISCKNTDNSTTTYYLINGFITGITG